MAIKRMFSKLVIETDNFADMDPISQLLYIHFGLNADDDGFIANYKTIMRSYGAGTDNLQELLDNDYIIPFQDGVIVIAHWKINNTLRGDRYKPTIYKEDLERLECQDGIYILKNDGIPSGSPYGIPNGGPSIVKDSLVKNSIVESSAAEDTTTDTRSHYGQYKNIPLTAPQYEDLCTRFSKKIAEETIDKMSRHINSKNGSGYGKNTFNKLCDWITQDYNDEEIKRALIREKNHQQLVDLEQRYLKA